jgi:hypothetical protein
LSWRVIKSPILPKPENEEWVFARVAQIQGLSINSVWSLIEVLKRPEETVERALLWPQSYILHWNGFVWQVVLQNYENSLASLHMLSSTEGWAVGANGTILRWDGNVWHKVESPTSEILYSIDMLSSTEGWAVGANGTIIRWDGNVWHEIENFTGDDLCSIKMLTSDSGWVITEFELWRYSR